MLNQKYSSSNNLADLSGKVALVTGAARGIGCYVSSCLANHGARVIIADYDAKCGNLTARKIEQSGLSAAFVYCDVTDESRVEQMVGETVSAEGGIDILVNNAGIYPQKPFLEMKGEDFRRVLEVNLTGTFLCSRYVAQAMVAAKRGGSIINITSIEAERSSSPGMSAYGASKAGVVMLTKSLAGELGHYGIRVNAVSPGGIITREMQTGENNTTVEAGKSQYDRLRNFLKRVPLGRMGEADDVANTVLFLASDLSSYITGEIVRVDGGYMVS